MKLDNKGLFHCYLRLCRLFPLISIFVALTDSILWFASSLTVEYLASHESDFLVWTYLYNDNRDVRWKTRCVTDFEVINTFNSSSNNSIESSPPDCATISGATSPHVRGRNALLLEMNQVPKESICLEKLACPTCVGGGRYKKLLLQLRPSEEMRVWNGSLLLDERDLDPETSSEVFVCLVNHHEGEYLKAMYLGDTLYKHLHTIHLTKIPSLLVTMLFSTVGCVLTILGKVIGALLFESLQSFMARLTRAGEDVLVGRVIQNLGFGRRTVTVSQLNIIRVQKLRTTHSSIMCSICLRTLRRGNLVRVLPCSDRHVFHKQCIDPWLLQFSKCCPNCRRDVTA